MAKARVRPPLLLILIRRMPLRKTEFGAGTFELPLGAEEQLAGIAPWAEDLRERCQLSLLPGLCPALGSGAVI
jgi:hypothetical protein